jgi:predicted RecB family nuclease
MSFSADERNLLLALKGVGPTVISRLEEMGYDSLAQLASANTQHIVSQAAAITSSTCWKNSPQARAAIDAVIQLAKQN